MFNTGAALNLALILALELALALKLVFFAHFSIFNGSTVPPIFVKLYQ